MRPRSWDGLRKLASPRSGCGRPHAHAHAHACAHARAHMPPAQTHLLQQLPQLSRAGVPRTHGLLRGDHCADTPALAVLGGAVHLPALLRVGGQHLEGGSGAREGGREKVRPEGGSRGNTQGRPSAPSRRRKRSEAARGGPREQRDPQARYEDSLISFFLIQGFLFFVFNSRATGVLASDQTDPLGCREGRPQARSWKWGGGPREDKCR